MANHAESEARGEVVALCGDALEKGVGEAVETTVVPKGVFELEGEREEHVEVEGLGVAVKCGLKDTVPEKVRRGDAVPVALRVGLGVMVVAPDRVPMAPLGEAMEGVAVGVVAAEEVAVEEGDADEAALGVQEGEKVARLVRVPCILGVNDTV